MNSALRAYQYPCSTEAHVCIRPTGSKLRRHMAIKPPLSAQNENRSRPSFHSNAGHQHAQAEKHQSDSQHAIDAKECRVPMERRRVESLHVVESDGWVNHEAKQTSPDHVPEGHRDEKVNGPFVAEYPRRRSRSPQVLRRVEIQQAPGERLPRR